METLKKGLSMLLILAFGINAYAQKPFMDYVLSWDGISSTLKVELTYSLSAKDSTTFIFGDPDFGGQPDIFKTIKNIRSSAPEKLEIDETKRKITVYHNGAKKHSIFYEIDGSFNVDKPTLSNATELFKPVITKGILTLVNLLFALNITDNTNPLVSFRWRKYPVHFTYFNSVQPSQTDPSAKVSDYYDELSKMVYFVMGDNISIKKYKVMGIPHYAITTQQDKYGNDLQGNLSPFFENYLPSIHRFWKDADLPFYFLVITALQNNKKEMGGGGFGIKNGFVMKLGRKFATREKYVTAHEISHSWIGSKMQIGETSFDNQWFGEGFNDYATVINLANSKIYNKDDFLHYLNEETLKPHYESKIKEVHNDSIATNYWTDYSNYGVLPYRRGLIYAFYLDNQIRLASNGKFTLRNMLLDLYQFRKKKKKDEILTIDDFINAGGLYLNKEVLSNQIKLHMIEGQTIDLSKIELIPEFKIEINNDIPKVSLTEGADLLKIYQW